MTTLLPDVLDVGELNQQVKAGNIRCQFHPTLPLRIYNYSDKCVYDSAWTREARLSRGLVVDSDQMIRARPYEKFWSVDQMQGHEDDWGVIPWHEPYEVYDKVDGCVLGKTQLSLWGGGTTTMSKVVKNKLSVDLIGMDDKGELVPSCVTGWHENGLKNEWLKIGVVSRAFGAGGTWGKINTLWITPNHVVWVNGVENRAANIQVGDRLTTQETSPDPDTLRMIEASLLGDGYISPTYGGTSRYQESHSEKQRSYAESIRAALGECGIDCSDRDTISGYGSVLVWANSKSYRCLTVMRDKWYPGGTKIIPPGDLSWMDDFAVAKWMMDDGHRAHNEFQKDRVLFSTNGFTEEDIVRLGNRLAEMYGISYATYEYAQKGITLRINSDSDWHLEDLFNAIAPHVHPSMRYKLPEWYQDSPYVPIAPGKHLVVAADAEVVSVESAPSKQGRFAYDLTTSTGNYMADGVIIHNSLGVLTPTDDGWIVATRGSFTSDQAIHATKVLQERYQPFTAGLGGTITPIVEIIYPDNRIVVNNGDFDDLVLLGGVEIRTGRSISPEMMVHALGWPGPVVEKYQARPFEELAAEDRSNKEGYVLHFPRSDFRVKVKHSTYLKLHRVLTHANSRTIWECLRDGVDLPQIDGVPEFDAWLENQRTTLLTQYSEVRRDAVRLLNRVHRLDDRKSQAEYLMANGDKTLASIVFRMLDGKDFNDLVWKAIKPEHSLPFWQDSESAA